jgi:hypothetical protein
MAAYQYHLSDAGFHEILELVSEDITAPYGEQTLWGVGGIWPEPTTPSSRQD